MPDSMQGKALLPRPEYAQEINPLVISLKYFGRWALLLPIGKDV